MQREEIRRRIASFPTWHYQFDLQGERTPIFKPDWANRHEQRKKYFFEPLLDLCGGSLVGKRVLDLGCNAGFWSLMAVQSGCDYVLGIDGRQMHIDQADFVFEANGVEEKRFEFVRGNIFDFDFAPYGSFDIVLCLGLLYHINKQVALLELIDGLNDDILVMDTDLSVLPGSYLRVKFEDVENPRHASENELVMVPTRRAVLDMVAGFGYSAVALKPQFSSYAASRKYRQGRRRAFLCAKQTPLRVSVPVESGSYLSSAKDYAWLMADNILKLPRKLRRRRSPV